MKRTLTVILAILMMLSAAGCYSATTPDGATRGRAYGGNITRGRAYSGAYDGLYHDANRGGFVGEGAHTIDGVVREVTPQGSTARGGHKYRRAHGNQTGARTHQGTTTTRNHQGNNHGNRPMVRGLEYVR